MKIPGFNHATCDRRRRGSTPLHYIPVTQNYNGTHQLTLNRNWYMEVLLSIRHLLKDWLSRKLLWMVHRMGLESHHNNLNASLRLYRSSAIFPWLSATSHMLTPTTSTVPLHLRLKLKPYHPSSRKREYISPPNARLLPRR